MSNLFISWACLVFIRFLFVFGTGYMHPDEFFQNPQIITQWIYPEYYSSHWTWEWESFIPVRSIIGPLLTVGGPVYFLGDKVESLLGILFISRIGPFFWSVVTDCMIWMLPYLFKGISNDSLLLLHASSWTTLVLSCRPFMNSFISLIYSLVIVTLTLLGSNYSVIYLSSAMRINTIYFMLGFLVSLGLYSHSSFLCYAAPVGLYILFRTSIKNLAVFSFGFCCSALTGMLLDFIFFNNHFVFPLLNNILYNSSLENLKEHGIHPKYLHVLVNMFILFGPAYGCFLFKFGVYIKSKRFLLGLIVFPLLLLSLVSHQEPRFLLPLAFPLFWIISEFSFVRKRIFIIIWVIFNVALGLFFGIFHQRGVIVGMGIAKELQAKQVIGYSVYMPPNYFMPRGVQVISNPSHAYLEHVSAFSKVRESQKVLSDIQGPFHFNLSSLDYPIVLILPEIMANDFTAIDTSSWKLLKKVYHFDMDLLSKFSCICNVYLIY